MAAGSRRRRVPRRPGRTAGTFGYGTSNLRTLWGGVDAVARRKVRPVGLETFLSVTRTVSLPCIPVNKFRNRTSRGGPWHDETPAAGRGRGRSGRLSPGGRWRGGARPARSNFSRSWCTSVVQATEVHQDPEGLAGQP